MTSKSAAPRPSEGSNTIGGPSPCVSTSIRQSPPCRRLRVTAGEGEVIELFLPRQKCFVPGCVVPDPVSPPRQRVPHQDQAGRKCHRSNEQRRCRRSPGRE